MHLDSRDSCLKWNTKTLIMTLSVICSSDRTIKSIDCCWSFFLYFFLIAWSYVSFLWKRRFKEKLGLVCTKANSKRQTPFTIWRDSYTSWLWLFCFGPGSLVIFLLLLYVNTVNTILSFSGKRKKYIVLVVLRWSQKDWNIEHS